MKSDSAMMLLSEYTPILAHSSQVQDTTASGRSWHKIQPREALHKFYRSHSPSCGLGSTWARASHEGGLFETHLAEQSTERKRDRERERERERETTEKEGEKDYHFRSACRSESARPCHLDLFGGLEQPGGTVGASQLMTGRKVPFHTASSCQPQLHCSASHASCCSMYSPFKDHIHNHSADACDQSQRWMCGCCHVWRKEAQGGMVLLMLAFPRRANDMLSVPPTPRKCPSDVFILPG